jgi:hypothetical protein
VKYSPTNLNSELDRAIKDAIKITQTVDKSKISLFKSQQTILQGCEILGLSLRSTDWILNEAISDTGFIGFGQYEKKFYLLLGYISTKEEMQKFLDDLPIIIHRIEKIYEKQVSEATEFESKLISPQVAVASVSRRKTVTPNYQEKLDDRKSKITLLNKIILGFIIDESLEKNEFVDSAIRVIGNAKKYSLAFSNNEEIVIDGRKLNYKREIITT